MKNPPFLLSTLIALVAVILSFVSFGTLQKNGTLQAELIKKQDEISSLNVDFNTKNTLANQNQQTIQTTQKVVELANPILQQAGYLAAKNKNEKLKTVLVRHKLDKVIPSDEDLKKIDKQIEEAKAKQGAPGAAAPATKEPSALRATTPAAPNP
jgi:hypothetical protein